MMAFGKYAVVELVSLTDQGSVSTARLGTGAPVYAVKQFNSRPADVDEPNWECQHFLDRARIQKSLAASGAKYWVTIHDLGMNADGAWFVSDYHPLSAKKLIEGRVRFREESLYNIVNSVIRGLLELQQVRRRPHGGLKPSNVLICGSGDLSSARILLSDPGPVLDDGPKGDMLALGRLLHELVLHRPYQSKPLPLPHDRAWRELGRHGDRWRQFCGALLAPAALDRPDLLQVCRLLRELTPTMPRKLRPRRLVPLGLAAGLAACLLLVMAYFTSSARQQLTRAKQGWIQALAASLHDPARLARYQSDPDLGAALNDLQQSNLANIVPDGSFFSNFSPFELHRLRAANASVRRIQQDLSIERWHRLARLVDVQRTYEGRGWDQPASYLSKCIGAARPRPGAVLADAFDRVLQLSALVDDPSAPVERQWRQLEQSARTLVDTRDPTLASFATALKLSSATALKLSYSGFEGTETLASNTDLAARAASVARADWPDNVDAARLASDLSSIFDLSHPRPQDIELWLRRVPRYTVRRPAVQQAASELANHLRTAGDSVPASRLPVVARAEFERDQRSLAAQIQQFSREKFIARDFDDGTFATRREQIETGIGKLGKYAQAALPVAPQYAQAAPPIAPKHAQGPPPIAKKYAQAAPPVAHKSAEAVPLVAQKSIHSEPPVELNAMPLVAGASRQVKEYLDSWSQWQLAAAKAKAQSEQAELAAGRLRAQAMQATLASLQRQFSAVPSDLPADFAAVARHQRDSRIARLTEAIDPKSPRIDSAALSSATRSFEQWCDDLRALSQDFPIRSDFLGPDDRPDEKWAAHDELWKNPEIQALIKGDLARLERLRNVDSASHPQLSRTARDSDVAEVAFEAWRRLGQQTSPPWPANASQMQTEAAISRHLQTMLAGLKDRSRGAAAALALLQTQEPLRWRRVVESAHDENTLAAAWDAQASFGVYPRQIDLLSARARYNLWLWCTRQAIAVGDEPTLAHALQELGKSASQLKGDSDAAAAAVAALADLNTPEPFAGRAVADTYKLAVQGVRPDIEFRRIQPASGRPFYLATNAISVGQFVAVIEAADAWEQCRQLPWPYLPGRPDPRRGPRTWQWADSLPARLQVPQLWLASEEANDFAPPLRAERFNRMVLSDAAGGMPSESHPIQYVSAQTALWFAALAGCRLPTSQEWLIAYSQYEKNASPSQWNLRDRTWETQRAYAAVGDADAADQRIDGAIFQPQMSGTEGLRDARSRRDDDGALFFRPVDSGGGSTFHHLVGNVGQFVCDAPRAFGSLADKSPQSIAKFAQQYSRSLYVIGGSALSSPALALDKPLPLGRADQGYADVGFRLAFTAPAASLAERARWALAGRSYLWPGAARTSTP